MTQQTFCVLPWNHLCIRPDETVKPCCRYQWQEDDTAPRLDDWDPENPYWTQLREDMLAGVPRPECKKCYSQEQTNDSSTRRHMNNVFGHLNPRDAVSTGIEYIEMSLDNICNLECKMCTSKFSSKLQLRDRYMGDTVHKKLEPNYQQLDRYNLDKLVRIKLLGGEPFISPNIHKFLNYLQKRIPLEQIALQVNTNGMQMPSPQVERRLQQMRRLEISVSMDGIGSSNNYQRWGSDSEQIFANAQNYRQRYSNSYVEFHTVIGVYTAFGLADLVNLHEQHNYETMIDFVRDPMWQSLLIVPDEFEQQVLQANAHNEFASRRLRAIFRERTYNAVEWQRLVQQTQKLDKFYSVNIQEYIPQVAEFINAA